MKPYNKAIAWIVFLPTLLGLISTDGELTHGLFSLSEVWNFKLACMVVSVVTVPASFLYFANKRKGLLVIAGLVINGIWLFLIVMGCLFGLLFNGPG